MPSRSSTVDARLNALEEAVRKDKSISNWLKTNWLGLASIAAAILIPLTGAFSSHEAQLNRLQQQVSDLDSNVRLVLDKGLKFGASLPREQLQQNLEALSDEVAVAHRLRLPVNRDAMNMLGQKLLNIEAGGQPYWNLAAELASYVSSSSVPASVSLTNLAARGSCSNVPMKGLTFDAQFNCTIVLDNQNLEKVAFQNAVVVYRGGKTHLVGVKLVDCYFILDVKTVPPSSGKELINTLLADGSHGVVTLTTT